MADSPSASTGGTDADLVDLRPRGHVDRRSGGRFLDVQEAVDAASAGDRIEVAAGTYTGPVRVGDVALEIVGVDGRANTRIVPGTGEAALVADGRAAVTIAGLTLDGGGAVPGAIVRYGSATLDDLVFEGSGPATIGGDL